MKELLQAMVLAHDHPQIRIAMQQVCWNCTFGLKTYGLNSCKLIDYAYVAHHDRPNNIVAWWNVNTDSSTRIYPDADNCPGFVVEPSLVNESTEITEEPFTGTPMQQWLALYPRYPRDDGSQWCPVPQRFYDRVWARLSPAQRAQTDPLAASLGLTALVLPTGEVIVVDYSFEQIPRGLWKG